MAHARTTCWPVPGTRLTTATVSHAYACPRCAARHRYAWPGWRSAVYCVGRENGDFHVARRPIGALADWAQAQRRPIVDRARTLWRSLRVEAPQAEPLPAWQLALTLGWLRLPALDVVDVHAWGVGIARIEAWRSRAAGACRRSVVATASWLRRLLVRGALCGACLALHLFVLHFLPHAPPGVLAALTVAAAANGNLTAAGTWGQADATSLNNSETAATTITTSFVESTAFTPGAITIDGIGIKVSNRTGTTGTISVHLAAAAVEVPGTLVTINMADLPAITTAAIDGGWAFFKFPAPVLLVIATAYTVGIKTSSATQANCYSSATTNWTRYLRTTTTGAPVAGDDMIVVGEYTAAGASTARTVTMDETATTDYGAASTSTVTPSLAIGQGGTFVFGATAATNYYLRQSGTVVVYQSGTLNVGTVGTPCPRDSTMKFNFDCAAAVDFGLTVRGGTFTAQGLSRTAGKLIDRCKLNTDEAIASTSLGVDTDTGWLDNDQIVVATTTQTRAQTEIGTMNGAAAASTLTVDGFAGAGGGLAFAHSGVSPTQAEAFLLTRNVSMFGAGASAVLPFYISVDSKATVDVDWAEFYYIGNNTAGKQGIMITTITGSFNMQYSSVHEANSGGTIGFNTTGATSNNFTFSNNVTYSTSQHIIVATTSGTNWDVSNNICATQPGGAAVMLMISDLGGTFTNNTIIGSGAAGVQLGDSAAATGTISGLTAHGNTGSGIVITQMFSDVLKTVGPFTTWRNAVATNSGGGFCTAGANSGLIGLQNILIDGITSFGNINQIALFAVMAGSIINNAVLNGDTTFTSTAGVAFPNANNCPIEVLFTNLDSGTASGIKTTCTNDLQINFGACSLSVRLHNCKLASATELIGQALLSRGSFISSQKHDQTAGLHKTWKREGTIAIETGTVHSSSHAFSMTPNSSATVTTKLESSSFFAAVTNGNTVTPVVYANKSAAYDGNQPRLICKKNVPLGVAADTVLATYSAGTGSWNSITGTTPAATDDGVFEFLVDCDYGTGGVVFVDSMTVN